jgi:hypothetical protein
MSFHVYAFAMPALSIHEMMPGRFLSVLPDSVYSRKKSKALVPSKKPTQKDRPESPLDRRFRGICLRVKVILTVMHS